ncbi:phage tail sheath subtilisin-like domain-containing protein [Pseudogulbenkiania ferrooxidans]|uniref:Mu tail sheath family protein n=1 Tax=Pseudogulbenkiania ferrooxidans 2002 TaxID=279714 RepID=B9Z303_9NEIS|nr:phage tail sheath subtilisin-like domain-containing protein [Pseudogulbenkiania ferrooxidans]EEG08956.1 Mu tail sheath family protein [Pseudogulbenkiania ferrooxidans 2002]
MNITFDKIPSSIRTPGKYIEFYTRAALKSLPANRQRTVLVAPKLTNVLTSNASPVIDVYSDEEAAAYCGYGSVGHLMARAFIRANPYGALSLVLLGDDAAGLAASGKITLATSATTSGTLIVSIGAETLRLAVDAGTTPAAAAAKVVAAVAAQPALPVTAAAAGGEVTFTAKHKAAVGNDIKLAASLTADSMTAAVTAMAGGANDASLQSALDAIQAAGHDLVVCPFATSAAALELREHLEYVGGPREKRWALGTLAHTGTLASAMGLQAAINSEWISLPWYRGAKRLPAEIAAAYAAVVASEEDPARPLNTLELVGLDVVDVTQQASNTEVENALWNGITPLTVGEGNRVVISRAITTYTKTVDGTADPTMLDITTPRSLIYGAKAVLQKLNREFPREKKSQRTQEKVWSACFDVCLSLEELEIYQNVEQHKAELVVQGDGQDVTRFNIRIPSSVVPGAHIFAVRMDLILE